MRKRMICRAALALGLLTTVLALALSTHAFGAGYIKGAITQGGQPVGSVWVTVVQNGTEKGSCPTGDDGRYYVGGLDNGVYEIVATHRGQQLCRRQVSIPNNSTYDIALPCN
jgi:hypothetical protein